LPRTLSRKPIACASSTAWIDRLYGESAALTVRENPGGGVLVDIYIPLRRGPAKREAVA
jgi:sensor histidine kinase YesM